MRSIVKNIIFLLCCSLMAQSCVLSCVSRCVKGVKGMDWEESTYVDENGDTITRYEYRGSLHMELSGGDGDSTKLKVSYSDGSSAFPADGLSVSLDVPVDVDDDDDFFFDGDGDD